MVSSQTFDVAFNPVPGLLDTDVGNVSEKRSAQEIGDIPQSVALKHRGNIPDNVVEQASLKAALAARFPSQFGQVVRGPEASAVVDE